MLRHKRRNPLWNRTGELKQINNVAPADSLDQIPKPSVVCTGSNGLSSYKCPPGATCDTRNDSCYGGDDDAEPTQTERETPTRTPEPSTEADDATITEAPKTIVITQTVGDDSTTTTEFEAKSTSVDDDSATTSAQISVSVSVVTVSATPTTTTGSSDAWLNSVGHRLMILALFVSVYL